MICCSLTALIVATAWMWRAAMKTLLRLSSAVALAAIAFTAAVFVAEHVDHYRSRAQANERTIIAEIIRAPLCTTPSQGAGIRLAQIERQ